MSQLIEDYALIGNMRTAALVGRNGSIDWLCLPRFDGRACFAALLGDRRHGRWSIAPKRDFRVSRRRYRKQTLVLETEFETDAGAVRISDCMSVWSGRCDIVRLVQGLRGRVAMQTELLMRFDYGSLVPWVRATDGGLTAVAGPDALQLRTSVPLRGADNARSSRSRR